MLGRFNCMTHLRGQFNRLTIFGRIEFNITNLYETTEPDEIDELIFSLKQLDWIKQLNDTHFFFSKFLFYNDFKLCKKNIFKYDIFGITSFNC